MNNRLRSVELQVAWFRLSGPMERHVALGGKARREQGNEEKKHVVVQGRPQFGRIVLLVEADLGDPHDKYYIRLYS